LEGVSADEFESILADAFEAADETREWIDFYFELLGERGNRYASAEGLWKFYHIQRAVDNDDRETAEELARVLREVGLQYVVDESADIRDHYRGMLVGMESHKRKNRQGDCFEDLVLERLRQVINRLATAGYEVQLEEQYTTAYNDDTGQSKTVDFALFDNTGELRLVVEANAYKGGGSKPSEIRRSYNHVARRMRRDGVAFVWVTDGQGWETSLENVLRESYEDITDLYNLYQADERPAEDVVRFFETGEV
jgi:DpnII restriction endonuclease.